MITYDQLFQKKKNLWSVISPLLLLFMSKIAIAFKYTVLYWNSLLQITFLLEDWVFTRLLEGGF